MITSGDASLLAELKAVAQEEVPEGWFTTEQWAEKWGRSASHASLLLRKGLKAGLVELEKYRIERPSGQLYPVPHYRRVDKTAENG